MKYTDFMKKNNNTKWLPDAILNIFVRAIAVDPDKYTHNKDLYMKVCAKFQLCKTIFKRNHKIKHLQSCAGRLFAHYHLWYFFWIP